MEDWAKEPDKDKIEQEKEEAEKETRLENDDPDELKKARDWDEYRDGKYLICELGCKKYMLEPLLPTLVSVSTLRFLIKVLCIKQCLLLLL
jgi:hypothetical protein